MDSGKVKRTASQVGKSNVSRSKTLERRVANLFQDWTGELFRRRRVEGRDSTIVDRESTADVISVKQGFRFSVEVKCGAGFSLDSLMANPHNCLVTKWIHQSVYDAEILQKAVGYKIYPLLFFKPSPGLDWVALSLNCVGDLLPEVPDPAITYCGYSKCGPIECDVSHSKKNKKMISLQLPNIIFMRWKDFTHYMPIDKLWRVTAPQIPSS